MKTSVLFVVAFAIGAPVMAQQSDSLRMDSIIHALPEVMVKGERPVVKAVGNKLVYDLPRLVENKAIDNVYDALQQLPGVIKMNGALQLGALPVTVILDGKVSTMTAEQLTTVLQSLPPSRVERVEVMYNAPARMQVRGAVINVVLRHDNADGSPMQGEVNLKYDQAHDASFGERATLLYHRGKWSVDAMYKHSHGKSFSWLDDRSHHALDDGSVHDVNTHEVDRVRSHGDDYRLGVDYDMAENHRLSLVYTGSYDKSTTHQVITGNVMGTTDIDGHSWLHNVRMDYAAPIGLKAGVEMTWYHAPEAQLLASTLPTGTLDYAVDNDQRVSRWKAFLAQDHTLGHGWGINYGAIYTTSLNRSRQIYTSVAQTTGTEPESSVTRQREDVVNVYVGFSKTFSSKLSVEASLAAEYYHRPALHRWRLYPTLNLTYQPAEGHYLQFGLSSDRLYPDYWAMTNFITYSNGGYNEVVGNPDLRPLTDYKAQIVYVLKNKYQFVGWFQHTDDYFAQTPYQRHDRLTVSYKVLNFDFQQQAGLMAAVPVKVGQWLDSRLSLIGIWQREKNSRFYDIPFDRDNVMTIVRMNNTITLSKRPDITLSVDGMVHTRGIQAIYDLPASGNLDLSARWQFWQKRAVLKVYCDDLFETSVINPRIDYMGQSLRMDISCYRQVGVSFTYRFGGYKEKQREEVDRSRFK
jgi:hypothetical protein